MNWNLSVASTDQFLPSFLDVCLNFWSMMSRSFEKYLLWYGSPLILLEGQSEILGEAFQGNMGSAREIFLKWSIKFDVWFFRDGYG